MIDTTTFSIFHRRPTASDDLGADTAVATPVIERPVRSAPLPEIVQIIETAAPAVTEDDFEIEPEWEPIPEPAWNASVNGIAAHADLLGLAHPNVITLMARLPAEQPTKLVAGFTGTYRPETGQDAEWAAFAREHLTRVRTGLAKGTHILTSRGEVEVENLQPGDTALALRGPALLPIVWIGRSAGATPRVRIDAGALGNDLPRRPLSLAPDHPVFIDPVPVPAYSLVNGSTIHSVEADDAELFQIDVGSSEVLFAEGVPLSSDQRADL